MRLPRLAVVASLATLLGANMFATGGAAGAPVRAHSATMTKRCRHVTRPVGTVTIAEGGLAGSLNPFCGCAPPDARAALFSSYFVVDNHQHVLPELATEVPTVANGGIRDGGRTIVIHLRPGATWSNGAEITSADVKFGWQTENNLEPQSLDLSGIGFSNDELDAACTPMCDIASVDTPSRYTAVFHLKRADPTFVPYQLPLPVPPRWRNWKTPQVAAYWLAQSGYNPLYEDFPTDGPYRVSTHVPQHGIALVPSPGYDVMACGASLARVVMVDEASMSAMISDAVTHRVDIVWNMPRLFDAVGISALRRFGYAYHIHLYPTGSIEHLELNTAAQFQGAPNPLHDVRVRQAIALAMDKQAMVREMFGLSGPIARESVQWSFLPISRDLTHAYADRSITGQWDPIAGRFVSDTGQGQALQDARALLAETPWRRGFALDVATQCPCPVQAAEKRSIARSLAQIGIHATFAEPRSQGSLFGSWLDGGILARGNFQAAVFSLGLQPAVDAYRFNFGSRYIPGTSPRSPWFMNYAHIHDPTIDRALASTLTTGNPTVWKRAWATVQQQVNRQAYWVPLFQQVAIEVDDGRVAPISYSAYDDGKQFWNIWAWHLTQVPARR